MVDVTEERVRPLTVEQLGLDGQRPQAAPESDSADAKNEVEKLAEDNPLLVEVRAALSMGFAGVILSGPPGTGKSYFAERISHTLADDPSAVHVVQFHASYQYEDFMQGFAPADDGSGFELQNKVFPLACKMASKNEKTTHVILIDEISRCDVARVFGEALTYLEPDKRGRVFQLASGKPLSVPENLIILATMNPWDKGVDELDVALERRFAQIDMPPDPDALRDILSEKKADPAFIERVVTFFEAVQAMDDELVHLGHAYFNSCVNEESAKRVWAFRLLPFFTKACRLDKEALSNIKRQWLKVVPIAENNKSDSDEAIAASDPGEQTEAQEAPSE